MSTHPVKEVVCALIIRNNRVLLAQRGPTKDQSGKWEFPGGKRGENESVEAALLREIREELRVDVSIIKPLTITQYGYAGFNVKLFPFLCQITQGEPLCTEHTAIEWVTAQNIMQFDLVPADIPVALEWALMSK